MKKICLFSTKATKGIEGEEAELYVNFYLVLNKNYIFTFLIDAPNLSCSDRHPINICVDMKKGLDVLDKYKAEDEG